MYEREAQIGFQKRLMVKQVTQSHVIINQSNELHRLAIASEEKKRKVKATLVFENRCEYEPVLFIMIMVIHDVGTGANTLSIRAPISLYLLSNTIPRRVTWLLTAKLTKCLLHWERVSYHDIIVHTKVILQWVTTHYIVYDI